jgi:hypothetical protein
MFNAAFQKTVVFMKGCSSQFSSRSHWCAFTLSIQGTVFRTILQALQGKDCKKVELNVASGVELTSI